LFPLERFHAKGYEGDKKNTIEATTKKRKKIAKQIKIKNRKGLFLRPWRQSRDKVTKHYEKKHSGDNNASEEKKKPRFYWILN